MAQVGTFECASGRMRPCMQAFSPLKAGVQGEQDTMYVALVFCSPPRVGASIVLDAHLELVGCDLAPMRFPWCGTTASGLQPGEPLLVQMDNNEACK